MFRRFDRPRRVRQGSSSEESYASPASTSAGMAVPGANTPILLSPQRFRRYRGSSTDEVRDEGEYINEDYRVGGPELAAMPCAMQPFPQSHPAYEMWERDSAFRETVKRVIQQHGIDVQSITPVLRVSSSPYYSRQAFPTLFISAKRQSTQDPSWLNACKKLRQYFAYRQLPSLNVEILDPRAAIKNLSSAVPADDPIYPIWEGKIIPNVRPIIGREGWVSLECFRWGPNEDRAKNATTVALTVPYDTDRDWKPVREGIINVLEGFRLYHVAVAILRGQLWRGATSGLPVLPNNAWETGVQCGVSLGPANSTFSASTFGCVFELRSPATNKWTPFGITCFHSVIARDKITAQEEKDCRARWLEHGVQPNENADALKYLRLDQPALKDHQYRMNLLDDSIQKVDNDPAIIKYRQDVKDGNFIIPVEERGCKITLGMQRNDIRLRDAAKRFFATGQAGLGYVFAASGFRTSPEPACQLDWALFHINEQRLARNKMPPVGMHQGRITFAGHPIRDPPQKDPKPGDVLFKYGRSTSATEGAFSGLKSLVLEMQTDDKGNSKSKETFEHYIMSFDNRYQFSEVGDSGAAVLDEERRFVGLLFAGAYEKNFAYFTPWRQLFDDIKAMTGAKEIRLYS